MNIKLYYSIAAFAVLLLSSVYGKAQELDPMDTGKALAQLAFEKSYNIKAGIGYQSFLVTEGDISFADKLKYTPDALLYFASFTASDRIEESNVYLNYELQFGQRSYKNEPLRSDTVSLLHCTSFKYYYISVPFQISIHKPLAKNAYWAVNPGVYFDLNLGDLKDEIYNGNLSKRLTVSSNFEDQDMKGFDWGGILSVEIGFRAAYLGLTYKTGFKNLAPDNTENLTIRNNGMFNVFAGYRFGTTMGRSDADKINNLVPM